MGWRNARLCFARVCAASIVGSEADLVLHWDEPSIAASGDETEVSLADSLTRVIADESFEVAVAAIDWALHSGAINRMDFESVVLRIPKERRGIVRWVDGGCESLPESFARTRLRLAGHSVTTQVRLGDLQRIDLVVDGHVGLEIDGAEFHRDRFESDRAKDIAITLNHLHAIRPSANAIFHGWDRVAAAIDTALSDRGIILQNSGHRRRLPFSEPGLTGWRE
jgi:very-short-patch-repair endonuclease